MKIKEGNQINTSQGTYTFVQIDHGVHKLFSSKCPTNRYTDTIYRTDDEFDVMEFCRLEGAKLHSTESGIPHFSDIRGKYHYRVEFDHSEQRWRGICMDDDVTINIFHGVDTFEKVENDVESYIRELTYIGG